MTRSELWNGFQKILMLRVGSHHANEIYDMARMMEAKAVEEEREEGMSDNHAALRDLEERVANLEKIIIAISSSTNHAMALGPDGRPKLLWTEYHGQRVYYSDENSS